MGEWEIMKSLGEGNTSKVYLAVHKEDPKRQVALKIFREEFLTRDNDSIKSVEKEIEILQGLKHDHIINIVQYGSDGHVKKPSGRELTNLVYILLEYVSGGLLFDVCQTLGGMGEEGGRYFMNQMLDVLQYVHGKGVVHRDLKLENILVDDKLNLKVADFGFATFRKIHSLKSYKGTKTYMAPEIKEQKKYDGMQIDIFSTGVILFIIVQGIFPFQEAKKDEYYYNLLLKGDYQTYWKKTGGDNLSDEFKDLILRMFSYDGDKRPTLKEIVEHPWVTKDINMKKVQSSLLAELVEKRSNATTAASDGKKDNRGPEMNDLILEQRKADPQTFHDQTDFIFNGNPGNLFDSLQEFNEEEFDGKMQLEHKESKHILITVPSEDEEVPDTVIKVKFFKYEGDQLLVHFQRKSGNIIQWAKDFQGMRDTALNYLCSANVPIEVEEN